MPGAPARLAPQPPSFRTDPQAAAGLWDGWERTRGVDERARLASFYREFARILAARCFGNRYSQELEFGDYLQLAQIGMLEAIDRFDPARGVPFEAYAEHRIVGAILNGAESLSEKQRQVATRVSMRRERARSLVEGAQSGAPDTTAALQRFADLAAGLALGLLLEDAAIVADVEKVDPSATPYECLEVAQLRERIDKLVDELPDAERRVIRHHYYQHVPFDEIARASNLSKGRISQIHHAAIKRLRQLSAQADRVVLVT